MKIIHLDSDDDIISIRDRLDWAEAQQVLFVLPEDGGVLREGLDLVRLRRYADRMRVEVGLVTPDIDITRQANALGLPAFASVGGAQQHRRGWWRGRKRRELVGLPTLGGDRLQPWRRVPRIDPVDRQEVHRRLAPLSLSRRWMVRYTAVFLVCLTITILYVSFAYAVPSATVILQPETELLRVEQPIVADPFIEVVDYGRHLVPGRVLATTQVWQADVATTGIVEVPNAPARGPVVFVNQLDQPVTVPAGTRISTSDESNIAFQTLAEVTLAGTVGSTAEVDVIAVAPGPQGNVAANLVNQVDGPLSLQVEVRNLEPLTGGGVREAPAVTEDDRMRLRAQVLQFLQALALSEMDTQLTAREFLTREAVQVVTILDETYSHDVGEQASRLALEIRAELHGTAVNTTEASELAYDAFVRQIPPDFTLVPQTLRFESGNIVAVDEEGRVTFSMVAEGTVAADLNLAAPITAITGQEPETAVAYLYEQLPLRETPTVDIWPLWFNRIPYLPARIQTEIEP